MASRIVEHFGRDTLEILGKSPERLAEVSGIGAKKAKSIGEAYHAISDLRELMLFLEENGVSGHYAASGGHTCVPEEELLRYTGQILQVEYVDVETVFQTMIANNLLRTEDWGGHRFIYPEYLYRAETGTARMLRALRDYPDSLGRVNVERVIAEWEAEAGIELADAQKEAIRSSLKYGVFALTGGPGTGKTTIIKGILSVLKRAGCTVLLAAPTGRAARRLEMAAGDKAQTVHRLLEYTVTGEFGKNADELLEAQAVIVDEASMLDITLLYHLLEALPLGCRLILVGDVDQLPSVGPGSVLTDPC